MEFTYVFAIYVYIHALLSITDDHGWMDAMCMLYVSHIVIRHQDVRAVVSIDMHVYIAQDLVTRAGEPWFMLALAPGLNERLHGKAADTEA